MSMLQFTQRRSQGPVRFPNQIREYRLRAGLSQATLGELVGRNRSIVSAWECGRSLPNLPSAFRLARSLGTLAESLYGSLYFPKREDGPEPEEG
jgi:DNA-binding XRE family transcriptional regulator